MRITREQFARLGTIQYEGFLRRLVADLEKKGLASYQCSVHDLLEDAIASGLSTEEAVSIYVECILKLKRSHFDVGKVKKVIASEDLDRDHKLIALKMMVFQVEHPTAKRRGPHACG